MAGPEGRYEDEKLSHETRERRYPGQRAQAAGQDAREERAPLGQAAVVRELLLRVVGAGQDRHHPEHRKGGDQVGEQVEIDRPDRASAPGRRCHRKEDEPGMGYARKGRSVASRCSA